MVFWLRGANTATLQQSVRSQEIKPVTFMVWHKDSCEQKAWEVIPQNQDYVCVKALAFCWNICNDRSVRIPCLYLCTTATQGFKTTSSTPWLVQTYLYTQKALSGQGSSWNILQEKNTYLKAMGKGRKQFWGKLHKGWAGLALCQTHTCYCCAADSGRQVPPDFPCDPLSGDRDPQCAYRDRAIPKQGLL